MAKSLKANCFDIVNINGKPVLFRTDDVAVNRFTFTIINLIGEPLSLKGGEPDINIRAKLPAASDASTFSIDFEAMLTEQVVANLKLTLPEKWAAAFSSGTLSTPPSWLLTPVADLVIGVGESVVFKIENIKCSETRPGNFEIMYRNIPGYRDSVFAVPKHLDVLNPPDPEKKTLPLKDGYINPVHPIDGQQVFYETDSVDAEIVAATEAVPVYITYDARALIENGFTYILTNTSKSPLVQRADVKGADAPVLYISFVFGDEDYAITTQRLGDNNITVDVNAKLIWQPSAHIGGTAYWQFFPQSSQVMEGLETVYFPVKKIITPLDTSGFMADHISIMYVQLNNIPGYNDAAFTVQMQKKPAEATMVKLDADAHVITYGQNIRLTWISSLARRVTISYETRDKEQIVLDSDKGEIKLNAAGFLLPVAPSAEYTVIRATAYGNGSQTSTTDITITVNQVQASIISFTASRQLIVSGTNTEVLLTWETVNAQRLELVTPGGRENVTGKTGITKVLRDPFNFTLEAWSYGTHFPAPTLARRKVFAFKTESPIKVTMSGDIKQKTPAILAAPKFARVYAQNSQGNTIYSINTIVPQADQVIPGWDMALSNSGNKLFTIAAERGFYVARLYDATSGSLAEKSRVDLPYEYTYQMLVTPDVTRLFCTVTYEHRGKLWENYVLLIRVDAQANTMVLGVKRMVNTIKGFPGLMAFNGDATKLYVVASSKLILVLEVATGDLIAMVQEEISNVIAFAAPKASKKLYAISQDANAVFVIDTVSDSLMNIIETGNLPSNMLLSPDNKYLCVSSFASEQLIMIDTESDTIAYRLPVGPAVRAMRFSDDGKLLIAANYCSKSALVIDFTIQEVLSPPLEMPRTDGSPFDIAIINDKDGYKLFISKESWTPRVSCADPVKNTNDNIAAFSIMKPADF